MPKYLAFIPLLLTGCGIGVSNVKRLPRYAIAIGDRVTIASDASIYACEARDTARSFWFDATITRRCVVSSLDVNQHMQVIGTIRSGAVFTVTNIKHINGVDTVYDNLYLTDLQGDAEYMVSDTFFPKLLGLPDGR